MPANASNRETARDELASLLAAALVGGGNPAVAVYEYQPSDLEGKSPVVLVLSSGSERMRRGMGTQKYRTFHRFEIISLVADASGDEGWTDQMVEDTLDLIEKTVADVIADNRAHSGFWEDIRHESGPSTIFPTIIGGDAYKMETMVAIAESHDA